MWACVGLEGGGGLALPVGPDQGLQADLRGEALQLVATLEVRRVVEEGTLPLDGLVLAIVVDAYVVRMSRAEVQRPILGR